MAEAAGYGGRMGRVGMVGDERVGGQGTDAAPVFGGSAEWGAAYEEYEAEVRRFVPRLWTLIGTPVTHGGPSEERERRFARRAADTLADLRSGHSVDPVRRAFVDTVRGRDLDGALIEEHLAAIRADCAARADGEAAGVHRLGRRRRANHPNGCPFPLFRGSNRSSVCLRKRSKGIRWPGG
ncbi:hypothetical protein GCM10023100_74790 [Actinocorallia cavernae]|uniref:Uncharacterized protein n=2 Tax=Actinomycetes TaxID=1760 RepID=A0ABP8T944_9ACTN